MADDLVSADVHDDYYATQQERTGSRFNDRSSLTPEMLLGVRQRLTLVLFELVVRDAADG